MTGKALQKQDWWKINGYFAIALGVYGIIVNVLSTTSSAVILGSLIAGGLNALVGLALLKHSKLVFWIFFILSLVGFVMILTRLTTILSNGPLTLLGFFITVAQLACQFMLLQQIRGEKKTSPTKKK